MSLYLKGTIAAILVLISFFLLFKTQTKSKLYRHSVVDQLESQGFIDFELVDYRRGNAFKLSQLKRKIVILNFWATWCEPCAKEMPDLVKLVQEFKGQVVLVAVTADEDESDLKSFLKAFGGLSGENVYILRDPNRKLADKYGVGLLPESFIFSPTGKLSRKVVGFVDWFNDSSISYMKSLLNEKTP